ncbi:uncharacterized protein [Apostichopus japonicus]|uniref:uncharacterized protein isoform X2 n=1 Tax=Stichopus japonicus TaxID=307972 RepID=UPI003AB7A211
MAAMHTAEVPPKLLFFTMFAFITVNVMFLINPCSANVEISIPEGSVIHLNFSFSYTGFGLIELRHNGNIVFVRLSDITEINSRTPPLFFDTSDGITSFTITDFVSPDSGQYICLLNKEQQEPVYDLSLIFPPTMFLQVIDSKNVAIGHLVELQSNIAVICTAVGAKPRMTLSWTIGNESKNASSSSVTNDNILFNTTSVLHHVPTNEQENISCTANFDGHKSDTSYHTSVTLNTYVPPTMFLQVIDSKNVAIGQWVEQKNSITVICTAVGAKPRMTLSWTIRNESKNASSSSVTNDNILFNTTSILHHVPTNEQENISCTATFGGRKSDTNYYTSVTLNTYVVPTDLSIIINDQDYFDTVHLPDNDTLVKVTFRSFGGRPYSSLSCKLSDPNSSMTDRNISGIQDYTRHGNIFNLSLSFQFFLLTQETTIFCLSKLQEVDIKINVSRKVTLPVSELPFVSVIPRITTKASIDGYIQWVIIGTVALLISLFIVSCSIIIKKCKFSRRASLSTNIGAASDGRANVEMTHLDQPIDQSSLGKTLPKKKPQSELPDIPTEEQISQHSESSESNYYAATKDSPCRERMFNEKDICLVLKMKKGRIYDRWMGTITVSRDVSKCVVLTALGDGAVKNKDVHWDDFVKRTLDLPKTNHLVKIEGIGIEKSFLYLITEHLVCDPLDSIITGDSSMQGEVTTIMSVTEVMEILAGILEGMEILQSYGFLHPGLSTKKILYTKQGQCKLYDFCLAEDAPKIIAFKTTQNGFKNLKSVPS